MPLKVSLLTLSARVPFFFGGGGGPFFVRPYTHQNKIELETWSLLDLPARRYWMSSASSKKTADPCFLWTPATPCGGQGVKKARNSCEVSLDGKLLHRTWDV